MLQAYKVLSFKCSYRDLNISARMTTSTGFPLQGQEWDAEQKVGGSDLCKHLNAQYCFNNSRTYIYQITPHLSAQFHLRKSKSYM